MGKYLWSLIATFFPKMTDFSWLDALQIVTYTVNSGTIKEMARDRHIVITHH